MLSDLIEAFSSRTPIGSALRSAQWEGVPQMLRDRSFFSARVEDVRWLSRAQELNRKILTGEREDGVLMDRTRFVEELQSLGRRLGLEPDDPAERGSITDPTSERRLRLIVNTQIEMALGYGEFLSGQDPEILDEWPAYELVRLRQAREPRDWPARWMSSEWGAQDLVAGRMIALKADPVWIRISRFGQPWPPFDYNSGMGFAEIDRDEAEELGLIAADDVIEPSVPDFNESLQASVRGLQPRMVGALETIFGDQIEIEDGKAKWRGGN